MDELNFFTKIKIEQETIRVGFLEHYFLKKKFLSK